MRQFVRALWALLPLAASGVLGQDEIGCSVRGGCVGATELSTSSAGDAGECLLMCNDDDTCNYFTFKSHEGNCYKYAECPSVSREECRDCVSGDSQCQCGINDFCQGDLFGSGIKEFESLCIEWCHTEPDCEWWSFDPSDGLCNLLTTCELTGDILFEDCTAGHRSCLAENTILLVSGGEAAFTHSPTVELHNLADPEGGPSGCRAVPNMPEALFNCNSFKVDGQPVFCSGNYGSTASTSCYRFSTSSWNWVIFPDLNHIRQESFGLQLPGEQLWVTGGYGGPWLDTTEMFDNHDYKWKEGPKLPYKVSGHCMALVNSSHAILAGGTDGVHLSKVTLYDLEADVWTPLEDMAKERFFLSCGVTKTAARGTEFVVTGGRGNDGLETETTEILNLDTMTWRSGPRLPMDPMSELTPVPFGDTFLTVGGSSLYHGNLEGILEFDPEQEAGAWGSYSNTLDEPRGHYPCAVLMNREVMDCY